MLDIKGLCLIALMAFQTNHTTPTYNKAETCFPDTGERIPVFTGMRADEATGLSEEEFMTVLDELEEVFNPVFENLGKTFVVNRLWDNDRVNATAQQSGDTWIINMYGGLARHQHATLDSFRTVACHEIGHHIGGAPKKSSWFGGTSWASNEGQSDYYATYQCMKKLILEGQSAGLEIASPDLSIYADEEVALVEEKCYERFGEVVAEPRPDENTDEDDAENEEDDTDTENEEETSEEREEGEETEVEIEKDTEFSACVRAGLAGLSLGRLLSFGGEKVISLHTPNENKVSSTNHNHPEAQCRADTYFAGALCDLDRNSELSDTDANLGTCNRKDGFEYGLRPLCWYKPSLEDEKEDGGIFGDWF